METTQQTPSLPFVKLDLNRPALWLRLPYTKTAIGMNCRVYKYRTGMVKFLGVDSRNIFRRTNSALSMEVDAYGASRYVRFRITRILDSTAPSRAQCA